MDVVCLRPSAEARGGSANLQAPGNVSFSSRQSDKLYTLLKQLYAVGGYSHTFGALDPVQVTQMGPHLSSIYVSGWQCSSTASTTNEPGPDFADYPMNTVRVCVCDVCSCATVSLRTSLLIPVLLLPFLFVPHLGLRHNNIRFPTRSISWCGHNCTTTVVNSRNAVWRFWRAEILASSSITSNRSLPTATLVTGACQPS